MEFYIFILLAGLLAAGIIAYANLKKWYTLLFIIGPVMLLVFYFIVLMLSESRSAGPRSEFIIYAILGIALMGYLLTMIGILCYCVKTYTAKKTNQQIEYLNYQIQDQVNILTAQAEQSAQSE